MKTATLIEFSNKSAAKYKNKTQIFWSKISLSLSTTLNITDVGRVDSKIIIILHNKGNLAQK